ncbi:MAG: DUF1566 domain-containing protein [Hydrogenophaga sp.]|uniref:Lcl domain-containing protein n=1 Tax=Hydrogenophaga sp. TaxID=1904254 RepID=UPI00273693A0|nr:DUF1566 domain-containing protein [Hydrogenophaga sp.]MDP3625047.1 DUF1566 domain-containing protein [Hydrogenophaga sp.]
METITKSLTPAETAAAITAAMADLVPPRIGEYWKTQGGVYVGVMRGRDGKLDYHLVAAIGEHELVDVVWGEYGKRVDGCDSYHDGQANTAAMATAGLDLAQRIQGLDIEGHNGWYLPSQAEAHLLAANVKEAMKPEAYWTSTQYSADSAWYQYFDYGYQLLDYKDAELRAVAVRQIQIVNA